MKLEVLTGGGVAAIPELDQIRSLAEEAPDQARHLLEARITRRSAEATGHADEARLAEELGLSQVAMRCWQLVLRDDPEQEAAWEALALLHEERGELTRARACRERTDRVSEPSAPEPPPQAPPGPSDADLVRLVDLFAGREDVHARMWHDRRQGTGYSPVREPLTPALVRAHLEGAITAGIYLLRLDETVRCLVLDLDATKPALDRARGDAPRTRALRRAIHEEGLRLHRATRALGLDPLFVDSGYKGRHLWLFLNRPVPAARARRALERLAAHLEPLAEGLVLERFPRQDHRTGKGLGNLVKLPMGLHLKSGRRCAVLDDQGEVHVDPLERIRSLRRVPIEVLETLPEAPPHPARPTPLAKPQAPPPEAPESPQWSRADFELSPTVGPLLRACPVLAEVVRAALDDRQLDRDRAVVLQHSLGHLPDGVRACNHLFDLIPGYPAEERMGAPHRGSPVSCKRIRQRCSEVASTHCRGCEFPEEPGRYPNPLRHLEGLPRRPARPAPRGLDELLAAYGRQVDIAQRTQAELDRLRQSAVSALEAVPDRRWRGPGGVWVLASEEGLPVLRWEPD